MSTFSHSNASKSEDEIIIHEYDEIKSNNELYFSIIVFVFLILFTLFIGFFLWKCAKNRNKNRGGRVLVRGGPTNGIPEMEMNAVPSEFHNQPPPPPSYVESQLQFEQTANKY